MDICGKLVSDENTYKETLREKYTGNKKSFKYEEFNKRFLSDGLILNKFTGLDEIEKEFNSQFDRILEIFESSVSRNEIFAKSTEGSNLFNYDFLLKVSQLRYKLFVESKVFLLVALNIWKDCYSSICKDIKTYVLKALTHVGVKVGKDE